MTTLYNTSRGTSWDPMLVEVWAHDGARPAGRVETPERLQVTWADRGASTAVLEAPLTDVTRMLLPADGSMLLAITLNGKRHLSSVVEATPSAKEGTGDVVGVKVVTASPWSLLDGQIIPPVPTSPMSQQESAAEFVVSGPVETVVKRLVQLGAARMGHPVYTTPDLGRGPTVTVRSRNDTVAELVSEALTGTGYRLSLDGWLPGDQQVGGQSLTSPAIIADVVPYRERPGLVWSHLGQELQSWSVTHKRATASRVIVGDRGEGTAQRFTVVEGTTPVSPWARREVVTTTRSDGEDPQATGSAELLRRGAVTSADVDVAPSALWEFGTDGATPLQYDVGDVATVELSGGVGSIQQIVTEVTATLTPVSLTVSPTVATPDTRARDIYTMVLDLDRRVDQYARR